MTRNGSTPKITKAHLSRHDLRVRLVADALTGHSDLSDEAAVKLAEHALDALDYMPETIR